MKIFTYITGHMP